MGNPKAFLTIPRQEAGYRPIHDRINDYSEVEQTLNTGERRLQASRCMDCGVPFCHWACPLGNRPPEFQDALYKGEWQKAYDILSRTNDFPEFTGRICPALCEKSCVLKLSLDAPVTIREDEAAIIEAAFREGYIRPQRYARNGGRVAVIGSGPAGLAAANGLNRRGYEVTVFERDDMIGGLLRYGIPNFKLSKSIIDRRLHIMEAEGITFRTDSEIDLAHLPEGFDAYAVCTGTPQARDLDIPGRDLGGIHFALDMLAQQNRVLAGQTFDEKECISARGRHVLVIGGGDTGSDCIGTSHRQGALSVTQIEIMPQPPVGHSAEDQFQPRGGLYAPLESELQPLYRTERPRHGRRSGGSGMAARPRRRTPRDEAHRPERSHQDRPRAARYGLPPTPAASAAGECRRGRRRRHRAQPRGEVHRRRKACRREHRPDAEREMSRRQPSAPCRRPPKPCGASTASAGTPEKQRKQTKEKRKTVFIPETDPYYVWNSLHLQHQRTNA